nr:trypsin-like serine protease [uncultured Psychroserpens sp.]
MTEEEANIKLLLKESEYFNLTATKNKNRTEYAAVVKLSNDFTIKNDYIIEVGLSDFTYQYDPVSIPIKTDFNKLISKQTINDFLDKNIVPVESESFALQTKKISGGSSVSYEGSLNKGGTLGALFKLKSGNKIYLLSNRHVIFDSDYNENKNKVVSPARIHVSKSLNEINTIGKIIWSSQKHDDILDAAIAEVNDKTKSCIDIGKYCVNNELSFNGIAKAKIGDSIKKFGKTTGLTYGEIKSINCTVNVSKNIKTPKIFRRQILTSNISDYGDSGSVVINQDNDVVGLLTGGNKTTASFCNNIKYIFNNELGPIYNFFKFV